MQAREYANSIAKACGGWQQIISAQYNNRLDLPKFYLGAFENSFSSDGKLLTAALELRPLATNNQRGRKRTAGTPRSGINAAQKMSSSGLLRDE